MPPITPSPLFDSLPKLKFDPPSHYIKGLMTTGAGIITNSVFMQYDLTFDDMSFVKAYNSGRSRKDAGINMTDNMCELLIETYEKEAAKTTQVGCATAHVNICALHPLLNTHVTIRVQL